jgi:hypothetical protein
MMNYISNLFGKQNFTIKVKLSGKSRKAALLQGFWKLNIQVGVL